MNSIITKGPNSVPKAIERTFWYSSAREGLLDLLNNSSDTGLHGAGVLAPAYVGWSSREGSGVFDPIIESQRPFELYGLNADLSTDLPSIASFLATGEYSHLILIHYFGRTDVNSEQVYHLARKHKVVVIDDLAHGFFTAAHSSKSFGGDAQLFSLHKQFPLEDGGMVRYKNSEIITKQKSTRNDLACKVMNYDWKVISELRIKNFHFLVNRLNSEAGGNSKFDILWSQLSEEDVPQSLPILLRGLPRDELYFALNNHGFGATSLYHTLIPESVGIYPDLDHLSQNIINLPLHQDCSEEDLGDMADAFLKIIELLSSK